MGASPFIPVDPSLISRGMMELILKANLRGSFSITGRIMMKPITVKAREEVLRVANELVRRKDKRSFSELLRDFIGKKRRGNLDVLMISFGTMTEEEAREYEKRVKEAGEWLNSWIPTS